MRRSVGNLFFIKQFFVKCFRNRSRVLLFTCFILFFWIRNSLKYSNAADDDISNKGHRLVVGILADYTLMNTIVNASQQTWIPLFPYDIYYFVGKKTGDMNDTLQLPNVIEVSANDNDYPPLDKTFEMWNYFYRNHLATYDYFMALDADSYVNVEKFKIMFRKVTCKECYIGAPSLGKTSERYDLRIKLPYCTGMGYIVSRRTLEKFGPYLKICRLSAVSSHSDTEIGRCIHQYASGVSCRKPENSSFSSVTFSADANGTLVRRTLNQRKQMIVPFPEAPPTRFYSAAVLHPIKSPQSFYQLHKQIMLQLRPIVPPVFAKNSCVANPIMQKEIYPDTPLLVECGYRLKQEPLKNLSSIHTFLVTSNNSSTSVQQILQIFGKHGIIPIPFSDGVRITLRNTSKAAKDQLKFYVTLTKLLQIAIEKNLQRILIIQEHSVPHHQFQVLMEQLLNDSRCQASVHGGVLLLGATMPENGWGILDTFNKSENGTCRNVCSQTDGSFAILLSNSTFEPILTWLRKQETPEPMRFLYIHLSRLGFPVRFAYPNLIISSSIHTKRESLSSKTNIGTQYANEAKINRWQVNHYDFPSRNKDTMNESIARRRISLFGWRLPFIHF